MVNTVNASLAVVCVDANSNLLMRCYESKCSLNRPGIKDLETWSRGGIFSKTRLKD